MADVKRQRGPSIDALAFDLLADAFLDVTGVLMRIDPDATKDLLRVIQERMVASVSGPVPHCDAAAGSARAGERAVWKAGIAIRAAEAVLSGRYPSSRAATITTAWGNEGGPSPGPDLAL